MKAIFQKMSLFLVLTILLITIRMQKAASATTDLGEQYVSTEHFVPQVNEYVYVCAVDCSDREQDIGPIGYDFDNTEGTAYGPQVLANEWHVQSQTQALQAGAVAIYTFSKRSTGGCGAIAGYHQQGSASYRVLHNCAQRYWLGSAPSFDCHDQTGQNTITSAHQDAVTNTRYETITQPNGSLACAKHFTNCGNPTADSSLEPNTLKSIPDPVDSDTLGVQRPGMSQNGSHAWELSDYKGAAPWDYRQILSHYYSNANVPNAHNSYRWAWLDVTPDIKFDSPTEDYYGPLARTPTTMETNQTYAVQMRTKNTGLIPWPNSGSQPIRLSYHWYDSSGTNLVSWDGLRTNLGQSVSPAGDVTLNAQVMAPSVAGTYVLKWDMVKEGVTWFSQQQNWPTQNVTVNVEWSEKAVFLPDIRSAYNNWDSVIYIRNDGTTSTNVTLTFFNANGTVLVGYPATYSVNPNAILYHNPESSNWRGSAVVDASEDVSVVVVQQHLSPDAYAAYGGVVQPTSEVFVPLLQKNNAGLYSDIFVQNTGTTATNLTVEFKAYTGSGCTRTYNNVPANGLRIISLSGISCVGNTFVGSARLTNSANQSLAVASTQHKLNHSQLMEDIAGGTANTLYTPLVQNDNSGWLSGLTLQNAYNGTNSLTTDYYNQGGGANPCYNTSYSRLAYNTQIVYPAPPSGNNCSVVASGVLRGGTKPVAAMLNQSWTGNYVSTYPAVANPGQSMSVPLWLKNRYGWSSGVVVQNINTQATQVTVTFYDANGSWIDDETRAVAGKGLEIFFAYPAGSSNFYGSAVVTADRPVAVAVNHLLSSSSGDGVMSHTGTHR